MSATLAPERFRFNVELLPGERVLWEGGAARASGWLRVLRVGSLVLAYCALLVASAVLDLATADCAGGPDSACDDELIVAIVIVYLAPFWLIPYWIADGLRRRNTWYVVTNTRVCIQGGALQVRMAMLDLDRIVAVQANTTWLERRFGIETIELAHDGASTFALVGMRPREQVLTRLLTEWLPRDNRAKEER